MGLRGPPRAGSSVDEDEFPPGQGDTPEKGECIYYHTIRTKGN